MTDTVSPAPAASIERSRQAAGKTVQGAGTSCSIVSFLLFQRPWHIAQPPDARAHRIATPEDDVSDAYDSELIRRAVATSMENVETVFCAINNGIDTIREIQRVTGLGKAVVQRAATMLEKNGRIVRAIPTSRRDRHRLKPVHNVKLTGA